MFKTESDEMQKPDGSCSIQYIGRENIENKLLASLSEDAKVACVFTCDELTLLINTFKQVKQPTTEQKAMAHDLRNFRTAAFGVSGDA
jgi:hypothetical protein